MAAVYPTQALLLCHQLQHLLELVKNHQPRTTSISNTLLRFGIRPAVMMFLGLAAATWGGPVHGEIAVFTSGDWVKIDSYELLHDDELKLALRGGGFLTLPVERIERIVDDEIVPEEERVAAAQPTFDLAFAPHHAEPTGAYGALIFETAKRFGINPNLIVAMTRAESAFDEEAVSVKGARGLMQLMPATAERFGVKPSELFIPSRNLEAGAGYLRWLIQRFDGDLIKVLAAYNAGEGAVDRHGGVPPYRETQGYVKKIVGYLGLSS